MEGNKDDALKCFKIGRDALQAGDRIRAKKFLKKAHRLDPSLAAVDDLLSKLSKESPADSSKPSDDGNSGVRPRASASGPSLSSSANSVAYTEEQVAIVRQIRRNKDYYEILGLEKTCSVEDVRKAYRKLSLKVHPDKNKAPAAEEAFKAVSKAFRCLSDAESRKRYDLVGSQEQPVFERRPARRGTQSFNRFYGADIDAEEIFKNFFYGGTRPATRPQFSGSSSGPARTADNGSAGLTARGALIRLLPVLLIQLIEFIALRNGTV